MVIIEGGLSRVAQESHGRLARGNLLPAEQVGDCRASHRAGVEAVEHGIAVGEVAFDGQRASGHHHHNHRLAALGDFGYQLALRALEVQLREGVGLSGENRLFSDYDHRRVSPGCGRPHPVEVAPVLVAAVVEPRLVDDVELFPERSEGSHGMLRLPVEGPGSELLVGGVGQRACHENGLRLEGKDSSVVLQEYRRLHRALSGGFEVLGRIVYLCGGLQVHVGVFEEAELELELEDVAHGTVNLLLRHLPFLHELLDILDEAVGHHVHVHSGIDCELRRVPEVGGVAVGYHLAGGVPVGDDHAVPAPLVAENVLQQPAVAG